ncbi:MAG: DUF1616 domain-containing protein [Candidatus Bathyarchaeia archaeon]
MKGKVDKILTALLLACLVFAIALTVYIAVSPHPGERFTEFYLLGPSGKAYGYPTNLTLGEKGMVIIGIVNNEYENATYRVVVALNNETLSVIDGITLSHGEVWRYNYTFTATVLGERMKLEFLLYKNGLENPYRSLHLWVTVNPGEER